MSFVWRWFEWTHRNTQDGWSQHALPGDGPLGQQDWRLMAMLQAVRHTMNALVSEQMKADTQARETRSWREGRAAGRR